MKSKRRESLSYNWYKEKTLKSVEHIISSIEKAKSKQQKREQQEGLSPSGERTRGREGDRGRGRGRGGGGDGKDNYPTPNRKLFGSMDQAGRVATPTHQKQKQKQEQVQNENAGEGNKFNTTQSGKDNGKGKVRGKRLSILFQRLSNSHSRDSDDSDMARDNGARPEKMILDDFMQLASPTASGEESDLLNSQPHHHAPERKTVLDDWMQLTGSMESLQESDELEEQDEESQESQEYAADLFTDVSASTRHVHSPHRNSSLNRRSSIELDAVENIIRKKNGKILLSFVLRGWSMLCRSHVHWKQYQKHISMKTFYRRLVAKTVTAKLFLIADSTFRDNSTRYALKHWFVVTCQHSKEYKQNTDKNKDRDRARERERNKARGGGEEKRAKGEAGTRQQLVASPRDLMASDIFKLEEDHMGPSSSSNSSHIPFQSPSLSLSTYHHSQPLSHSESRSGHRAGAAGAGAGAGAGGAGGAPPRHRPPIPSSSSSLSSLLPPKPPAQTSSRGRESLI